jgi:lysophospholipase L1-like esterase
MRQTFWATALVALIAANAASATEPRILLVGDSWAWFMWINNSFQQALTERGIDVGVEGLYTTVPGSEARQWIDEKFLNQVTTQLKAHPTIDVVHLSIGGNDFLRRWQPDMTREEEKAVFTEIMADTETVIRHILDARPDVRVALSDYDYINKTKRGCSYEDLNTAGQRLARMRIDMTQRLERCTYIHNYGLMQYLYGIPDAFGPGEVPYPGNAPAYEPFPGGITAHGNPEAAMFDDIHLNMGGYHKLALHCIDTVYAQWLGVETHSQKRTASGVNSPASTTVATANR